jgi:hypothetical protein
MSLSKGVCTSTSAARTVQTLKGRINSLRKADFSSLNVWRVHEIFAFEKYSRVILIIKMLQQQRHSGMDCRNPDYRDVFIACHPWLLDLGNPCRDDDIFVIKI